jgi:hypothetical protein
MVNTSDPFRHETEALKAIQDFQRSVKPMQRLAEDFARAQRDMLSHASGLSGAYAAFFASRDQMHAMLKIDEATRQMREVQDSISRHAEPLRGTLARLERDATTWKRLISPQTQILADIRAAAEFHQIMRASAAWSASSLDLFSRFRDVGLIEQRHDLLERLLSPANVFTAFAEHTINQIERAVDAETANALELSLCLAQEQLVDGAETFVAIAAVPEDSEAAGAERELEAPYVQQRELLASITTRSEHPVPTTGSHSQALQGATMAQSVLCSIATCNQASKVKTGREIFKPTTRVLEVYADLPWIAPSEQKTLAEFVDCLYFLFYESAGKDNLRFQKKNGGPLDDSDFEFVLCIKHLRNKWLRHDADHGKEADIRKAWEQLRDQLRWLGQDHFPASAADFGALHRALLGKADEFVKRIIAGLTGSVS